MTWMEAYFHWRPLLIEALDQRYYGPEWLDAQVMSGRAVFLHGDDYALVFEVRFFPTGAKDLAILCSAGDPIKTRDEMDAPINAIAKAAGCVAITVESREAWSRLLKPIGFELYKTTVRKDL